MTNPIVELQRQINDLRRQISAAETRETGWHIPAEPFTSTSYNGNDTVGVGTTSIDTSAVFGIPAGVRAVCVYLAGTWASASASSYAVLLKKGGTTAQAIIYAQVASIPSTIQAIIPCDSSGDIDLVVVNANMTNTILRIVGYLL